jgi:hypothetical protein
MTLREPIVPTLHEVLPTLPTNDLFWSPVNSEKAYEQVAYKQMYGGGRRDEPPRRRPPPPAIQRVPPGGVRPPIRRAASSPRFETVRPQVDYVYYQAQPPRVRI